MPLAVFFSSRSTIQIPDRCRVWHQRWTNLGASLWERRNYKLWAALHGSEFGNPGKIFSYSTCIFQTLALKTLYHLFVAQHLVSVKIILMKFSAARWRSRLLPPPPTFWKVSAQIQSTTSPWQPSPIKASVPSPMRYHRGPCKPVCNPFYSPNGSEWNQWHSLSHCPCSCLFSLKWNVKKCCTFPLKAWKLFSLSPASSSASNSRVCSGSCQSWIKKKKNVATTHLLRRGGFISFLATLVVWLFVFPLQLVLISHNSIYDLGMIRLIYIKVYLLLFWWDLRGDNPSRRVQRHSICRTTWFYLWCVWVRKKLSRKKEIEPYIQQVFCFLTYLSFSYDLIFLCQQQVHSFHTTETQKMSVFHPHHKGSRTKKKLPECTFTYSCRPNHF